MLKVFGLFAFSVLIAFAIYSILPSVKQPVIQAPSPSPIVFLNTQLASAGTENWQTYTSAKHKFSIKLPPQFAQESSGDTLESFHQGEESICCGYVGPNLNVFISPDLQTAIVGMQKSPSDFIDRFTVAGHDLERLSGLGGIRIGVLEHNENFYVFQVFGKDKSEEDFQQVYTMLSTFKFTD